MKRPVIFLILLLIITFAAGCNNASKSDVEKQPAQTAASQDNTNIKNTKLKKEPVDAKNTEPKKETPDFSIYKGDWKLKVEGNEELYLITSLSEYLGSTGIKIAETNKGIIKGSIYSIQGAPSHRQAVVEFTGKIEDGKLSASYKDEAWLYSGKIELTFEKEMIKANITRDKVEPSPMWGIPEGNFAFVKPIKAEKTNLTDKEKDSLEKFLFPAAKGRIKPFAEGGLTDEMIINFVGCNIALGFIDTGKFGDKVKSNADIIFDKSVMNELSMKYFGLEVKNHKTVEIATYENGKYKVPALGGVSEYPKVQLLIKDSENNGVHYAIVDYISENPKDGKKLEYQHLIKLQNNGGNYTIKAIKEIKYPVVFR